MIKVLLLGIFLSAVLASPTWTGKWLAIEEQSAYLDKCDIPLNNTIATIAVSNHSLVLRATSAYTHHKTTWPLGWNTSEEYGSDCEEEDNCVTGFIYDEGARGTFLNISWNRPGYHWCSALFVPADTVLQPESDFYQVSQPNNEEEPFNELISGVPWFFMVMEGPEDQQKFLRK